MSYILTECLILLISNTKLRLVNRGEKKEERNKLPKMRERERERGRERER